MTKDYTATRASADRLLAKFGQTVTLTRRTAGNRNLSTGTSSVSETTQSGTGVIFDYAPGLKAGDSIMSGDRQCYLSALKTDGSVLTRPKPKDTLTANSVKWSVVAVSEVSPAGTDVLYDLQLRGADA